MNVKKRLEREAQCTHQKILEDSDQRILSSFGVQNEPQRPKSHWKAWLAGVACTVSAAIVIVCAVVFSLRSRPYIYFEKDFIKSSSDIVTLNKDLKDFQIDFGENVIATNFKRTIDGPSGDLLYYEMQLQTADSRIHVYITIICNQNFDYTDLIPFKPSYEQQTQLYGYPFQYILSATPDPTLQLTTIQAHAKLEGDNEIIFLTNYIEVSLDENGTLLEFIQDLVKAK